MFAGVELETIALAALLAFCRIGACFMLMPGFGSIRIATNIRLFVAVAVSWALLVHLWEDILPFAERDTDELLLLVLSELLIGGLIGLVARIYVLALQYAGSAIAMSTGYGGMVGNSIEEAEPQAALTAFITFAALLVLFALDFHHAVVRAIVTSYDVAPLDVFFNPQSALIDMTDVLGDSFYIAVRLASPFIAYAILVNLATGFINKLAPQIPVYFVSLPFVLAGGLILLYFGISSLLSLFGAGFVPTTIGR